MVKKGRLISRRRTELDHILRLKTTMEIYMEDLTAQLYLTFSEFEYRSNFKG